MRSPKRTVTLYDQPNAGLDAGLGDGLVLNEVLQGHRGLYLHWELLVPCEAVHHLGVQVVTRVGNK